jgi:hypothetical protein
MGARARPRPARLGRRSDRASARLVTANARHVTRRIRYELAGQECTRRELARLLDCSERTVQRIDYVRRHGIPELVELVRPGEVPLGLARRIARLEPTAVRGARRRDHARAPPPRPILRRRSRRARRGRRARAAAGTAGALVRGACDANLDGRRADARYCSTRCRVAAHRARRARLGQSARAAPRANAALGRMATAMERAGVEPATSGLQSRACSATTGHDTPRLPMVEPKRGSCVMRRYPCYVA